MAKRGSSKESGRGRGGGGGGKSTLGDGGAKFIPGLGGRVGKGIFPPGGGGGGGGGIFPLD